MSLRLSGFDGKTGSFESLSIAFVAERVAVGERGTASRLLKKIRHRRVAPLESTLSKAIWRKRIQMSEISLAETLSAAC